MRCLHDVRRSKPSSVGMVLAIGLAAAVAACGRSHEQADWPAYNGSFDGRRFSPLDQINTSNVANLQTVCKVRLGENGTMQAGPVVIGRTLYVTTAHTTVAIDAATCAVRWRRVCPLTHKDVFPVNRGVAYLDGRVFRGTGDGRLLSLSADSGTVLWNVQAGDPAAGEFLSSAPIAWNGKVYIGVAGSDWGVRGHMMAFDANTGKELWRFWTIPMGSEQGADTWKNAESAKHGGGGTWTSYALDTVSGELFVPVANPAPDFNPSARPGDNLFTNSVVVLDANTGALRWWFQFTPHDGFDWDVGAAPMLYPARDGTRRVAAGSKDGNVYAIDRASHKLLFTTAITTIRHADMVPTQRGVDVCPGWLGGVEWNGPAYDSSADALYVGAVDWCGTVKLGAPEYKPGEFFLGTGIQMAPSDSATGWLTALDAETGAVRWRFHAPKPVVSAVTPTAGGLVLGGDVAGTFYALDKTDGKVLFQHAMGGSVAGGIVTYAVDGKQYVALTAGNVSRVTFGGAGHPTVIVMGLEAPEGAQNVELPSVPIPGDTSVAGKPLGAGDGERIFGNTCSVCHGAHGEGAAGPNLQKTKRDLAGIIQFVENPTAPMPKLYPSSLSEADVRAVAEYVLTLRKR